MQLVWGASNGIEADRSQYRSEERPRTITLMDLHMARTMSGIRRHFIFCHPRPKFCGERAKEGLLFVTTHWCGEDAQRAARMKAGAKADYF